VGVKNRVFLQSAHSYGFAFGFDDGAGSSVALVFASSLLAFSEKLKQSHVKKKKFMQCYYTYVRYTVFAVSTIKQNNEHKNIGKRKNINSKYWKPR